MFPPGWAGRASTALVCSGNRAQRPQEGGSAYSGAAEPPTGFRLGLGKQRMLIRNLSARSGKGLAFSSTLKAPKVGHPSQQHRVPAKNAGLQSNSPGFQFMLSPSVDKDVKPLTLSLSSKDALSQMKLNNSLINSSTISLGTQTGPLFCLP